MGVGVLDTPVCLYHVVFRVVDAFPAFAVPAVFAALTLAALVPALTPAAVRHAA